jgi:hypothetical protein
MFSETFNNKDEINTSLINAKAKRINAENIITPPNCPQETPIGVDITKPKKPARANLSASFFRLNIPTRELKDSNNNKIPTI